MKNCSNCFVEDCLECPNFPEEKKVKIQTDIDNELKENVRKFNLKSCVSTDVI